MNTSSDLAAVSAVPKRHIDALDGLRGLAILLVMLYHFHFDFRGDSGYGHWMLMALNFGWCGVDLFFVLSGFLITGILLQDKGTPRYFRTFYIRRALRIFPLYYAFLFFVLVVVYNVTDRSLHAGRWVAWYVLYLSNWKPDHGFGDSFLTHLWSLAVEEQFYLVWPLIVKLSSRHVLAVVCLAAIVAAPALRYSFLAHGVGYETVYRLTITRMDALAWGALLALARTSAYWAKLQPAFPALLLVSSAAAATAFIADRELGWAHEIATWGDSALLLAFAALISFTLCDSRVASLFSASWLRKFGKYSYSMYLFQQIVAEGLTPRVLHVANISRHPFIFKLLFLPFAVGVTYGCSLLSWTLFERRFLALKDRFAPRQEKTAYHPAKALTATAGGLPPL